MTMERHINMNLMMQNTAFVMGLDSKTEDLVKNTLFSYIGESRAVGASGFLASLDWVFFRMANAIRSIFGCSAWQQTTKVLTDNIIKILSSPSSLPPMQKATIEKTARVYANFILKEGFEGKELPLGKEQYNKISLAFKQYCYGLLPSDQIKNIQTNVAKASMEGLNTEAELSQTAFDKLPNEAFMASTFRGILKGTGQALKDGIVFAVLKNQLDLNALKGHMNRPNAEILKFLKELPYLSDRFATLTEDDIEIAKLTLTEFATGQVNPNLSSAAISAAMGLGGLSSAQLDESRATSVAYANQQCPPALKKILVDNFSEISAFYVPVIALKKQTALPSLFVAMIPKEFEFIKSLTGTQVYNILTPMYEFAKSLQPNGKPSKHTLQSVIKNALEQIPSDLVLEMFKNLLPQAPIPDQMKDFISSLVNIARIDALKEVVNALVRWELPSGDSMKTLFPNEVLERLAQVLIDIADSKPISFSATFPELSKADRDAALPGIAMGIMALALVPVAGSALSRLRISVVE